MKIPVEESGTATADANGDASAKFTNYRAFRWVITRLISVVSGSTTEASLRVYKNAISTANQIDSTYTANNAVSGSNEFELRRGESLIFVWSDATPGATCTGNIQGSIS